MGNTPVVRLNAQWTEPTMDDCDDRLGSGSSAGGHTPDRTATVRDLSTLLDHPPAVLLTGSCTHALEAAAVLCDIGSGDEVIVPAFTFPSTANAFLLRGATVRFADISAVDGNMGVDTVTPLITERTRAIVPVHYAGMAVDMEPLGALADSHGAVVIEDAAHGMFARLDGTPLARHGALGAISFHRTKNVTAGDGGALVVNDPALVERSRAVVDKGTNRADFVAGRVDAYEWVEMGSAWAMPDTAVDLLAGSMSRRRAIQSVRHWMWARYAQELSDWARAHAVTLPTVRAGVEHPAHIFWIVLPDASRRHDVVEHCAASGVEVARHFGSLPDSAYGRRINVHDDDCPVASSFSSRLLRLPLHHELGDEDVDAVVRAVTSSPI